MRAARRADDSDLPGAASPAHRRYYKDGGLEMLLTRDSAARTPCEAAWKVPSYRKSVAEWLGASVLQGHRLVVAVEMPGPGRERRNAVFIRVLRTYEGALMVVAMDAVTGTVFCGRRLARRSA